LLCSRRAILQHQLSNLRQIAGAKAQAGGAVLVAAVVHFPRAVVNAERREKGAIGECQRAVTACLTEPDREQMDRCAVVVESRSGRVGEWTRQQELDLIRSKDPIVVSSSRRFVPLEAAGHRQQIVDRDLRLGSVDLRHGWMYQLVETLRCAGDRALGDGYANEEGHDALSRRADIMESIGVDAREILLA